MIHPQQTNNAYNEIETIPPPQPDFGGDPQGNGLTSATNRQASQSRTRDHLANERTYLAWMRTAIALMGFGVVISRLHILSPNIPGTRRGWAIGLLFALSSLLSVLLSTQHYFAIRHAVDADAYEPSYRWMTLFSLIVILLGTGVIYVLFTVPESSRLTLFE